MISILLTGCVRNIGLQQVNTAGILDNQYNESLNADGCLVSIYYFTPVYQSVLDFRPSEVKFMLDYMRDCDWAPDTDIVNRPNYETTKLEEDILSKPELLLLENKIDSEVHKFAKSLQLDLSKHGLKRINSWGNLQRKGNYIAEHRHNNTQFAGVFYLQVPEGSERYCFYY